MRSFLRVVGAATLIGIVAAGTTIVRADDDDGGRGRNSYQVTSLVSNLTGAATTDPVLQNAWGIAFSPAGSPFWVNDNDTGCSTLYTGAGAKIGLQVSIPLPGNVIAANSCQPFDFNNPPSVTPAAPTGIIWNPSAAFLVPGTKTAAAFKIGRAHV